MNTNPLFFRDEGEMGNVLDQAKNLSVEIEKIHDDVEFQSKKVDEFKEELEEAITKETINNRIGKKIRDTKNNFSAFVTDWKEKRSTLVKSESELMLQHQHILSEKEEMGLKQPEPTTGEVNNEISSELKRLNKLSAEITQKLDKIESTKETIDKIIANNGDEIKENVLSLDDAEFFGYNYFNLIKSRLLSDKTFDPTSGDKYLKDDFKLEDFDHSFVARVKKSVFEKNSPFTIDVRLLIPVNEGGYIYKKAGVEYNGLIMDFINSDDFESFNFLVLVSPTGWSEKVISRMNLVSSKNQSIVIVDLLERRIYTNNNEASEQIADLFSPISLNEETQKLVEILNSEINDGTMQFRADKMSAKYKVSRKVVVNAFKTMEKSGNGEIIDTDEGAKDIIFFTR